MIRVLTVVCFGHIEASCHPVETSTVPLVPLIELLYPRSCYYTFGNHIHLGTVNNIDAELLLLCYFEKNSQKSSSHT